MAQIVLEKVSKVYSPNVKAVDELSLRAEDGQLVVLVGPSGCGKSTTLRMIAGLEECDSGIITIGKKVVNRIRPKDRNIAMVFQNYALYPHMSVYKNMAFGLELRWGGGWPERIGNFLVRPRYARKLATRRQTIPGRVNDAARSLNIDHLLHRFPRHLSGGERQRVALGRAIVRDPAVFLFDEPLSNLDAKLRVETRREIKRLHQTLSATMIYVTHDQIEALTLGDRIVVMEQGKVQQIGEPSDVYDQPANRFVAGFIGSPAMNFVPGNVQRGDGCLHFVVQSHVGFDLHIELRRAPKNNAHNTVTNSPHKSLTPAICVSATTYERLFRLVEKKEQRVELGIRPEDLVIQQPQEQLLPDNQTGGSDSANLEWGAIPGQLRGQVTMLESIGDAAIVHFTLRGGERSGPSHDLASEKNAAANRGQTKDDIVQRGNEEKNSKLADNQLAESWRMGGASLTCKTRSARHLRRGAGVVFGVNPQRLHVFDAQTGENLTLPSRT